MGEIEVNGVKYNGAMPPQDFPLDRSATNKLLMSLPTFEIHGAIRPLPSVLPR